ncbi:MAG: hypothetical protein P8O03_03830 [Ilumatobacter sp.]|nr:hypothetical protein [Ilumatobacter sp.]
MSMSYDTRRRVILIFVVLIIVALVLGSVGCSSTSGNSANDNALTPTLYTQAMSDICDAATERLNELPAPPNEISRADWAGEVSRALGAEATAFDELNVGDDRRTDHASFIENTEGQAAGWNDLGDALGDAEPDRSMISKLTTDLAELTLGRNDLAGEMGLAGCRARELT